MQAKAYGPGISGALFGGGWWFWVDACAASHTKVPFVQYLPGIVATLALIMINAIRRYIPTFHLLANHVWVTFQKPGHHACLPAWALPSPCSDTMPACIMQHLRPVHAMSGLPVITCPRLCKQ